MPTSKEQISALAQELADLRIENKRLTAAYHLAIPMTKPSTVDAIQDSIEIYRLTEEIKKAKFSNQNIDKAIKRREQAIRPHVPDIEPPPNPHIPDHDDKGNPKKPKPEEDQFPPPEPIIDPPPGPPRPEQ